MMNINQVRMLAATFCILLAGAICATAQEAAQTTPTLHNMARIPGHMAGNSDPEEAPTASNKPRWSSGFEWTFDSALSISSAVYNPATNVMIVFAGEDWGMSALSNAVLLQTPANGHGKWSTLIANGTAGSPRTFLCRVRCKARPCCTVS
jgi:hypothetical protein